MGVYIGVNDRTWIWICSMLVILFHLTLATVYPFPNLHIPQASPSSAKEKAVHVMLCSSDQGPLQVGTTFV